MVRLGTCIYIYLLRDWKSPLVQGEKLAALLKIGPTDRNLHISSTFSSNARLPGTYIILQVSYHNNLCRRKPIAAEVFIHQVSPFFNFLLQH